MDLAYHCQPSLHWLTCPKGVHQFRYFLYTNPIVCLCMHTLFRLTFYNIYARAVNKIICCTHCGRKYLNLCTPSGHASHCLLGIEQFSNTLVYQFLLRIWIIYRTPRFIVQFKVKGACHLSFLKMQFHLIIKEKTISVCQFILQHLIY